MKKLYFMLWSTLGVLVVMFGCLIVDSSGPVRWTYGMVVSTHFEEGATISNDIKVEDVTVPIRTEIPGAWIVEIGSPLLGKVAVPVSDNNFHAGQAVYLGYRVGRLTSGREVVALQSHQSSPVVVQ